VNHTTRQKLLRRKRRIQNVWPNPSCAPAPSRCLPPAIFHYDIADRTRGLNCAGVGAIHQMARRVGLIDALDRDVNLLKVHLPYHESDHILNIAYNFMVGGTCLEDLELRRNNEVSSTPSARDAFPTRRPPGLLPAVHQ